MERIIAKQLLDWVRSARRKPLIVRGARQVGKTWLVEHCLAKQFEHVVKLDLEKQPQFHAAFLGELSPRKMLDAIEIHGDRIVPGRTLLFLDEIQSCPRAITALRYFYEELPELHVVAAGSMLEFAFGEISFPVGRVQFMHVPPMTFYEYLLAMGNEVAAETLLAHPREHHEFVAKVLQEQLRDYFLVGGMPEAVKVYRETQSKLEAFKIHDQIVTSYRADFPKYRPMVNYACLDGVFESACRSAGQQIQYTRLYEHATGFTNHKAFDLLCKAQLINKVRATNPSGVPLGGAVGKRFKAFMLDIGLMQHECGVDAPLVAQSTDLLAPYRGQLAEQFVAQELVAWHHQDLYYWSRTAKSANAEVDFLTIRDGAIYPVEVKSGPAGKLKSLHLCLKTYPNCKQGWVLRDGPYQELPEQKLVFWPLYAVVHLGDREQLSC